MNEACLNFMDKSIASEEGRSFALEVMDHLREKLTRFQEETGDFYNLEATPAEGTTYRLARLDQKRFGPEALFANSEAVRLGAAPFYTNSTHLPVNHTDDLFEAVELQDELQSRYTGGTVLHGFVGEEISDVRTVRELVKKITGNFKLPYFTITPTFSICQSHGYFSGESALCPECGQKMEVYSRVVSYLRPVSRWNDGKQQAYSMRTEYVPAKTVPHKDSAVS